MGLPVFKAAGALAAVASGWPTVSWPAGHGAGDFALMLVQYRANTTVTPATPSGWTRVIDVNNGTSPGRQGTIFYRFATSSSEPNVTLTGGTTTVVTATILTWTGVNTGTPIHSLNPFNSQASSTIYMAGATTVLANCLAIMFSAIGTTGAGPYVSTITNSDLASLANRFDGGTTLGSGGGHIVLEGQLASPATIQQTTVALAITPGSSAVAATLFLQSTDHALPTTAMKNRVVDSQM